MSANIFVRGSLKARTIAIMCERLKRGEAAPKYKELARILGVQPPSANTTLVQLKKSGAVVIQDGVVASVDAKIIESRLVNITKSRLQSGDPSPREKVFALVKVCDWEGIPWPKRPDICGKLGISKGTLNNSLRALALQGMIYRAAAHCYRVVDEHV